MSSDRARQRLQDIVDNANWIEDHLGSLGLDSFKRDRKTADAVERCLRWITEAVIQLGEEQAERSLDVAWHEVRSLGNRPRHEYRRIDLGTIYATARSDVPALRAAAASALDS